MTRVTGTLHHVLGNAEAITEVWVRSARARGHGGGWLMETSARTPITDAHLSLDITPGPAILVAVAEGQPLEHIEIIVPDADSETLEHCITAAQGTSGRSAEVLDLLRQQIASDLSESAKAVTNSRAAASEAESSAHAAASSASEASRSADAAASADSSASEHEKHAASHATAAARSEKDAQSSASAASASATAAAGSAGKAKEEADRATGQARAASTSAGEAKANADRAEGVVDTVRWDADRLTVMGKTSPSLRGQKGDRGEPGGVRGVDIEGNDTDPVASGTKSLALGWGARAGGIYSSTVGSGSQASGDYSTAVGRRSDAGGIYTTSVGYGAQAGGSGSTAVGRDARVAAGHFQSTAIGASVVTTSSYQTRIGSPDSKYHVSLAGDVRLTQGPSRSDNATTKQYVDSAVAEARAFAETRAIVRQVTSPPSTHELGVLYVIPE